MLLGLVSDTHGVVDEELLQRFRDARVDSILHAGDIGNHGGHGEVLARFGAVATVHACSGNVDAGPGCPPAHQHLELAGWRVLLTHVVGQPAHKVEPAAAQLIERAAPHVVVFGHSHVYCEAADPRSGVLYYNPGSAGPARFRLPRTAALLDLPDRATGAQPTCTRLELAAKAPPRLAGCTKAKRPAAEAGPVPDPGAAPGAAAAGAEARAEPGAVAAPKQPAGSGTRGRAAGSHEAAPASKGKRQRRQQAAA